MQGIDSKGYRALATIKTAPTGPPSELPFSAAAYILSIAMSRMFQNYKSSDEPVPGYRLVRFLGKGNFGEVWLASAPGNKKVALKIIDLRGREGLQESKAIERIKDINHAHLVSIFAYWVIDDEGRILDDQSIAELALGNSAVKEDEAGKRDDARGSFCGCGRWN